MNDSVLPKKIAATNRQVIFSIGGTSQKDTDDLVIFFEQRNIPLAVNHCVLVYLTEECELEPNKAEYLTARYPGNITSLRQVSEAGL